MFNLVGFFYRWYVLELVWSMLFGFWGFVFSWKVGLEYNIFLSVFLLAVENVIAFRSYQPQPLRDHWVGDCGVHMLSFSQVLLFLSLSFSFLLFLLHSLHCKIVKKCTYGSLFFIDGRVMFVYFSYLFSISGVALVGFLKSSPSDFHPFRRGNNILISPFRLIAKKKKSSTFT